MFCFVLFFTKDFIRRMLHCIQGLLQQSQPGGGMRPSLAPSPSPVHLLNIRLIFFVSSKPILWCSSGGYKNQHIVLKAQKVPWGPGGKYRMWSLSSSLVRGRISMHEIIRDFRAVGDGLWSKVEYFSGVPQVNYCKLPSCLSIWPSPHPTIRISCFLHSILFTATLYYSSLYVYLAPLPRNTFLMGKNNIYNFCLLETVSTKSCTQLSW